MITKINNDKPSANPNPTRIINCNLNPSTRPPAHPHTHQAIHRWPNDIVLCCWIDGWIEIMIRFHVTSSKAVSYNQLLSNNPDLIWCQLISSNSFHSFQVNDVECSKNFKCHLFPERVAYSIRSTVTGISLLWPDKIPIRNRPILYNFILLSTIWWLYPVSNLWFIYLFNQYHSVDWGGQWRLKGCKHSTYTQEEL